MKIPQSNTSMTIQCTNQLITHQGANHDVESSQIRDKLRKKKQIAKPVTKKHLNQKEKRKELISSKKCQNYFQSGNQQKPMRKTDVNEMEENEDTRVGQEAVQLFFENELSKYYPAPQPITKTGSRFSKKTAQQTTEGQVQRYLDELRGQNEVNLAGLLQQRQKVLFKSTKLSEMDQYEEEAMGFIEQIRKKQGKQKCEFYNNSKFQKRLELILQTQGSSQNTALYFSSNSLEPNLQNLSSISLLQKLYLTEAKAFQKTWQHDLAPKIKEPHEVKYLTKLLLILAKCYKTNNKRLKEILYTYKQQQEQITQQTNTKLHPEKLSQPSNNQFYIKCLLKKCLIKTFSEQETLFTSDHQLWNHFKLTSYLEQNIIQEGYRDHEKYLFIQNDDQYKEYMKRIKNKKIIYKPSLHTNCKACFSSHFQRSNPIVKCPDCKSRIHKHCGKIDDRCDKCNYKKLGASLKAETPKCFICHNESTSLMIHKLKGTKFVHNFCMFAHNLWTVTNQKLTFRINKKQQTQNGDSTKTFEPIKSTQSANSLSLGQRNSIKSTSIIICDEKEENSFSKQMVDESDEINIQQQLVSYNSNKCKFCSKFCQKEYLKRCQHCQESFHVLCAYLNGCSIEISEWNNTFEMDLSIKCCSLAGQQSIEFENIRAKRQMCRKYRLNFDRFALNYGFENQLKTSKAIQSCCNIAQVEQQKEKKMVKENQEDEVDPLLSDMKDQSQEQSQMQC